MKATKRIAVRTCIELYGVDLARPNLVKPEVIEMAPLAPEETLHTYLRRYFEKISRGKIRQFAEQKEVSTIEVVPAGRLGPGQQPKS
jgi:hypothetical protein